MIQAPFLLHLRSLSDRGVFACLAKSIQSIPNFILMFKNLQKLTALVLVCCAFLGSSNAWGQVFYEPFPTTGALTSTGNWSNNSGTAGQLQIVANSLTYADLPASEGNKVALQATDSEDAKIALTENVTSGSAYASFLIKPESGFLANSSTSGNYFFHFIGHTSGTYVSRVSIRMGSADNTFNLGVLNSSGGTATAEAVFGSNPVDYATGQTYLVVIKYDIATNTSSIWVNPATGSDEAAAVASNNLGGSATQITGVAIRQSNSSGAGTGNMQLDEIRVGTTWASVTPSGVPSTTPTVTPATGSVDLGDKLIGTSAVQFYTLTASNIPAEQNVVLTATAPFTIAKSETGPFSNSITFTGAELATEQKVYVTATPTEAGEVSGEIVHTSAGATDATVKVVVYGSSAFTQDFNRCSSDISGGWMQYSVTGDQMWACTSFGMDVTNAVQMSGYASGNKANVDWLISPALDLTTFNLPLVSFNYRTKYDGDALQVKVSTDYTGTGDPSTATWTDLVSLPANDADAWMLFQNLGLDQYKSANTYLTFVYTSTTESAARWTLDNFKVENAENYITTSDLNFNFGETAVGNTSAAKQFTFQAMGFEQDVVVAAPANFELSKDGEAYAQSLTYTAAEAAASNTVFVRFAPATAVAYNAGPVTFTSGEATAVTRGMLTGTSVLKANTLDIVTWNLEWFGSTGNGPSDEQLQYNNAKKALQELDADIIGLQEIVDEAKVQQLANELGYSYISEVMPWQGSSDQKSVFLYKTGVVTVKKEKVVLAKLYADIKAGTATLPDYPNNNPNLLWSSGRLPYLVQFEATINGVTQTVNVINIHAKANSGDDMVQYNRRKYDVQVLKDTLDAQYANTNLVLLGDYNDDVDMSVVGTNNPSTYAPFVTDEDFVALTYELSTTGAATYESGSFSSFLDHIIITKELGDEYIENSIAIQSQFLSSIANFRSTTSDHLPVLARFDFSSTPVVTFTQAAVTKAEDAVKFNVNLTLSAAHTTDQTVSIRLQDGATATAEDYTTAPAASNGMFTLTVPAGATSAAFEVQLIDDTAKEETEKVTFMIYNTSAELGMGAERDFTLTIEDNDETPTGIADATKGQFSVYPNPVQDYVRLSLPERVRGFQNVSLVAYGIDGRALFSVKGSLDNVQQVLNNSVATLKQGMYILKIEAGKEVFVTRMLKK